MILGPILSSRSFSQSFIQIRDIPYFAKKYGYNKILLADPHPLSWISFINVCLKNKLIPIIAYPYKNILFFPTDSQELIKLIAFNNGILSENHIKDIEHIEISEYPLITLPSTDFESFFDNEKNLPILEKDVFTKLIEKNEKLNTILNFADKVFTNYNLKDFFVNIPNLGGIKTLKEKLKPFFSKKEFQLRLKKELKIIDSLNVADYILTVSKIVETAKKIDAMVGPGRGSAVGSLVVYLLGITSVNPLKYNLLFERFLHLQRKEMPDIDLDIESTKRDDVVLELEKTFGKYRVANVRTFMKLKMKSVLKKTRELTGEDIDFPLKNPIRSPDNYENYKKLDDKRKFLYRIAYFLEGKEMGKSVHAAGVIISEEDLRKKLPVDNRINDTPVVEWDMDELKLIGIEKFDVLSLDTLAFLKKLGYKEVITTDLENKKVYSMISEGLTAGIFQLDSNLGKRLSRYVKPKNFKDLYILLSLNRPGPLETSMVDNFVKGNSKSYLKELFPETKGVLVFQEQIMMIAQILAGLTPEESDDFRKGVAKKDKEKIEKYKERFIYGAAKKIGKNEAKKLFEDILKFAEYAFNKSHSVAYAHITYNLAKAKAENPTKFFYYYILFKGIDLNILNEMLYLNIKIFNPNLNYPLGLFKDKFVILPLTLVKGIGEAITVKLLEDIEKNGKFKDFEDFWNRMKFLGIGRNIIEILIRSGALDFLKKGRKEMIRLLTQKDMGLTDDIMEIKSSVFGEKVDKKSKKEIEEKIEDLAKYDIETIGFPLSIFHSKIIQKTSKALIKTYFEPKKFIKAKVLHFQNYLLDRSSIIFTKNFSSKMILKEVYVNFSGQIKR